MGVVYDKILGRVREADENGGGGGGGGTTDTVARAMASAAQASADACFTVPVTTSTDASLAITDSMRVVDWSPVSDATLASVASPSAGYVRCWEVRLALAANATLTLGAGIAFAVDKDGTSDEVAGGCVNILLVRATSAGATVYVCGTEESE